MFGNLLRLIKLSDINLIKKIQTVQISSVYCIYFYLSHQSNLERYTKNFLVPKLLHILLVLQWRDNHKVINILPSRADQYSQ